MIRASEFIIFVAVAVALHLWAMWHTETVAPPAMGGIVSAGGAMAGVTDDLEALLEAWKQEPDITPAPELEISEPDVDAPDVDVVEESMVAALELQPPPSVDTPPKTPTTLPTEADPVARQAQPQEPSGPSPATPSPPMTMVTPSADPSAPMLPDLPQSTAPAPALPVPSTPRVDPRVAELAPDPTTRPGPPSDAPVALAPPTISPLPPATPDQEVAVERPAPPLIPPPSAPTTIDPPRVVEPEPEPEPEPDTEPAPLIAAVPVAKPNRPEPPKPAKPKAAPAPQFAATPQTQAGADGAAQGQSTAAVQGEGGSSQAPAFSAAAVASAEQTYISAVRAAVARNKKYPRRAKRRGVQGTVRIQLTLDASGRLVNVRLVSPSGASMLDEAAMDAVRAVGEYPRIPAEMERASVRITVPIRFAVR